MAAVVPASFSNFLLLPRGRHVKLFHMSTSPWTRGYIDRQEFERLNELAERTLYLVGGLMKYLQQSNIKGAKYKR